MNQKKHCNTCNYSYCQIGKRSYLPGGTKTQYCASADYNSNNYTHELLMEDWGTGCCRFWTPREERTEHYEKQLFHRPTQ